MRGIIKFRLAAKIPAHRFTGKIRAARGKSVSKIVGETRGAKWKGILLILW